MFPIYEIGYGFSMLASLTSERTGSWNVSIFLFRMMIKMERQRRGKEESASTQSLMEGKNNLLTSTAKFSDVAQSWNSMELQGTL